MTKKQICLRAPNRPAPRPLHTTEPGRFGPLWASFRGAESRLSHLRPCGKILAAPHNRTTKLVLNKNHLFSGVCPLDTSACISERPVGKTTKLMHLGSVSEVHPGGQVFPTMKDPLTSPHTPLQACAVVQPPTGRLPGVTGVTHRWGPASWTSEPVSLLQMPKQATAGDTPHPTSKQPPYASTAAQNHIIQKDALMPVGDSTHC